MDHPLNSLRHRRQRFTAAFLTPEQNGAVVLRSTNEKDRIDFNEKIDRNIQGTIRPIFFRMVKSTDTVDS